MGGENVQLWWVRMTTQTDDWRVLSKKSMREIERIPRFMVCLTVNNSRSGGVGVCNSSRGAKLKKMASGESKNRLYKFREGASKVAVGNQNRK